MIIECRMASFELDTRLLLSLAPALAALGLAAVREVQNRRKLRRLSDEVEQYEQRLRQVIFASPIATVVFDDRGAIRSLNPAAEHLFRCVEDQAIGHNFQVLVRFSEAAPVLDFQKIARLHVELKAIAIRRGGDEFPADVVITQMLPRPEHAFVAFISEAREAACRLAVELNNVLTMIVGYSDLLRETVSGEHREDFAQIESAGQRAAALGSELLDLSRSGKAR